MDIPLDVEVFCTDGLCGRSTSVVVKPKTEEVTHLVLKEREAPHQEILVPVTAVTAATPDSINLGYTKRELTSLPPFIETDYVQVDVPRYAGAMYSMAPYVYEEVETLPVQHEAIPDDELAVHRGARVEATDGRVGNVDEFLVDPDSDRITHLVLREGHLWGQKDVTVPVSEIEHMEESTVYLKLAKREIAALPAIPARRKGL